MVKVPRKKALYKKYEQDRDRYTNLIIDSPSRKKVVAAGPGTGKTFLFEQVCQSHGGTKILTLTFINQLVNDLKNKLSQYSDVKTLHSFAMKELRSKFFPKLTEVIEDDYDLTFKKRVNFKKEFSKMLATAEGDLKFYSDRRKYYDHFGPHCSIYTLIKIYEKDANKIPDYDQILIDEFQDFSRLEIRLVDLLSEKSPILIVGDDDQSLYSFKHADPGDIRKKWISKEYEPFELPYCSRCTKVLVDSSNAIIAEALKRGHLVGRIPKKFLYFPSEEKDKISGKNSKIKVKKAIYKNLLATNIDNDLSEIFNSDRDFSVLIICTLTNQIEPLKKALLRKGFGYIQTPGEKVKLSKEDGYRILLKDEDCNLGWRILVSFLYDKVTAASIIQKSCSSFEKFRDLYDETGREKVLLILKILNKIKLGDKISKAEGNLVFEDLGYDPFKITLDKLKEKIRVNVRSGVYKNLQIKITTLQGSKGLTADYVFLVNFDSRFVLENGTKITDECIYKFLVALTRAGKKLQIYSATNSLPVFVDWLSKHLYDEN